MYNRVIRFTIISIGIVGLGCVSMFADRLVVPTSESIVPSLLWRMDGPAREGDYVTFYLAHRRLNNGGHLLTKRLTCMPGHTLENRERYYYCDGKWIGTALEKDGKGRMLEHFEFHGVIPEGMAFVLGDHPLSFDSRYWGFIPLSKAKKSIVII